MKIYQIFTQSALRNFSYIITSDSRDRTLCIDPFDGDMINAFLGQHSLKLDLILNTHEHWDHHQGNAQLVRRTGAKICAHPLAAKTIPHVDRHLQAGEKIFIDKDSYLQVIETPGHTFAHICFLLFCKGSAESIFTGDTLFNAGVGNCHHGGDPKTLFHTITQIFGNLPDSLKIYPGHDYLENNLRFALSWDPENVLALEILNKRQTNDHFVGTLGQERKINPFLRLDDPIIQNSLAEKFPEIKDPETLFLNLRQARDNW